LTIAILKQLGFPSAWSFGFALALHAPVEFCSEPRHHICGVTLAAAKGWELVKLFKARYMRHTGAGRTP
jgi:hypothetical protein